LLITARRAANRATSLYSIFLTGCRGHDRLASSIGTGNYRGHATLRYLGKKRKIVAKVVCVLYEDPVDGYPKSYARDDVPKINVYPDGQTLPTPEAIDFEPGTLLGSVSGELGLRKFLEGRGHTLVVTCDKDGTESVFERELADAEVVISQPFWPAYLNAERI